MSVSMQGYDPTKGIGVKGSEDRALGDPHGKRRGRAGARVVDNTERVLR